MNIFWVLAWHYGWRHLVKMPLEAVQCAYAVWHNLEGVDGDWCKLDGDIPPPETQSGARGALGLGGMKRSHYAHPVVRWMMLSGANYLCALEKAKEILEVYSLQYQRCNKPPSALYDHIDWLENNLPPSLQDTRDSSHLSIPPVCPPTLLGRPATSWKEVRKSYQHIYATSKRKIALDLGKMPTREEYEACSHALPFEEFIAKRKVAPWIPKDQED